MLVVLDVGKRVIDNTKASVTIDGVKFVVDSGFVKVCRYAMIRRSSTLTKIADSCL